jgi:DNA-binding response OmpR family regulator
MNEIKKTQFVLVVDDHPRVLRLIEADLKLLGYDVLTTTSGEEALELVKTRKPDIMILDIIMPGTDGLEVLKQLRAFSQIPVIALSANLGERDNALRLGANDFVVKPFNSDEIVKRIEKLIGD